MKMPVAVIESIVNTLLSTSDTCASPHPGCDGVISPCEGCKRVLCSEHYFSGAAAHAPGCPVGDEQDGRYPYA
jgi:hypothetical protein